MLNIQKITQTQFYRDLDGAKVSLLGYVKLPTYDMADALKSFDHLLLLHKTGNTGIFHKRSKDFYREFEDGQKSYGFTAGNTIFAAKSPAGKDCYFLVNPKYYPNEPESSYAIVYRKEA